MKDKIQRKEIENIEIKFLGTIFHKPALINDAVNALRKESFSTSDHQAIFEGMMLVHDDHRKITIDAVVEAMDDRYAKTEWTEKIRNVSTDCLELTEMNGTYDDTEFFEFIDLIRERSHKRRMINHYAECSKDLVSGDKDTDYARQQYEALQNDLENEKPTTSVRLYDQVVIQFDQWQKIQDGEEEFTARLSTGFPTLDRELGGGIMRPSLCTFSGRPSMGKSNFCNQMCKDMARRGEKVLMISTEMTRVAIANREIFRMGKVSEQQMKEGLEAEQWELLIEETARFQAFRDNLFVDDRSVTPEKIFSTIHRHIRRHDVSVILIDYIQNISWPPTTGESHVQIASFIKKLDRIAQEQGVIIIAVSQLSRAYENRIASFMSNKRNEEEEFPRPTMADHSDTKKFDESSSQMVCIFREEVYRPNGPCQGQADLLVLKNRGGRTGKATVRFDGEFCTFSDYASP